MLQGTHQGACAVLAWGGHLPAVKKLSGGIKRKMRSCAAHPSAKSSSRRADRRLGSDQPRSLCSIFSASGGEQHDISSPPTPRGGGGGRSGCASQPRRYRLARTRTSQGDSSRVRPVDARTAEHCGRSRPAGLSSPKPAQDRLNGDTAHQVLPRRDALRTGERTALAGGRLLEIVGQG